MILWGPQGAHGKVPTFARKRRMRSSAVFAEALAEIGGVKPYGRLLPEATPAQHGWAARADVRREWAGQPTSEVLIFGDAAPDVTFTKQNV